MSNMRVTYTTVVHGSQSLAYDALDQRFQELSSGRKIVSFGYEHDRNTDTSFEEVHELKDLVFRIHHKHQCLSHPTISAEEHTETIREEIDKEGQSEAVASLLGKLQQTPIQELCGYHPGRLFAARLLPLLIEQGFTDIIVEGLFNHNPQESHRRSKDKIGQLLMMLQAIMGGLRVHGVYDAGFLDIAGLAIDVHRTINEIHAHVPDARIITCGSMVHNMTLPIEGALSMLGAKLDLSKLSFARDLQQRWGEEYQSIDLIGVANSDENNILHVGDLRKYAQPGGIVEVSHSDNQVAFVLSP